MDWSLGQSLQLPTCQPDGLQRDRAETCSHPPIDASEIDLMVSALQPSDPQSDSHVYHTKTPLLGDVEIKTMADLSVMRGLRLIHPWISPLVDQDFADHEALFNLDLRALRLLIRLRRPFGEYIATS